MAKGVRDKKRSTHGKGGDSTAPRKKARVEVTYENGATPTGTTSSIARVKVERDAEEAVITAESPSLPGLDKGKAKALDQSSEVQTVEQGTFVIIAGSYEKLLYGLEGTLQPPGVTQDSADEDATPDAGSSSSKVDLKPIFIFPAHLACVKAVAASPGGKWLATGSEDEFVKVWDLRRRREMGSLSQHTGSITSLHFPSSSHLVSTSVDGTIALFRTSDWACLKALKGHSGRVNHVDVHPTGRVALSVGKDMTLKMWDLMRGRGASSLALGTEAEIVKFSPLGTHFAVLFPKKIELYSLTLRLLQRVETKSRFNTLEFAFIPGTSDSHDATEGKEQEVLCIGTEKGVVEVRRVVIGDAEEGQSEEASDSAAEPVPSKDGDERRPTGAAQLDILCTLMGHTNRIKSLSTLSQPVITADGTDVSRTTLLSTVSSDGHINLYDLSAALSTPDSALNSGADSGSFSRQIQPVASYDTKGSRLTCVFLADGKKPQGGKATGIKQDSGRSVAGGAAQEAKKENDADDGEEEDDDEEDQEGEDMYEQESQDDEAANDGLEGVEVEFEDEEEEEEEEEELEGDEE